MVERIAYLGLVDDGEIELDKAALEIAALDHPEASLSPYFSLLDEIAEHLEGCARPHGPADQAARLAETLAGDFGFEGDRATYDDPDNADLIRVIDRRRGLPIALSIIYVAVARRVGWAAHPLNTPTHVLTAVGAPRPVVVDPFNRGAPVGEAQLVSFLRATLGPRARLSAEHLAPMSNRSALVRLMANQATRAEAADQFARALTLQQRITAVAPAYSFGWWDRARLERATGDNASARKSLTAMLETTRDPDLRTRVIEALTDLGG